MSTQETRTITLRFPSGGFEEVQAVCVGLWAAHWRVGPDCHPGPVLGREGEREFTVTHIPTGYRCTPEGIHLTWFEACGLALELDEAQLDLPQSKPEELDRQEFRRAGFVVQHFLRRQGYGPVTLRKKWKVSHA